MNRRDAMIVTLSTLLSSCGTRPGDRHIVIGSKNFTEQIVLAELLSQAIHARTGIEVEPRTNLGGSLICQAAILSGAIDLYVEYTGTALTAVLHESPSGNQAEVYARVKRDYASRFNLEVTEPLGFENTFALVIRGEDARTLKLKSISDIAPFAPKWKIGIGYEFMERPDGYHGLVVAYHLHFEGPPRVMELGLFYRALQEKKVDIVAGNSTDGVISALGFVVLEDDRHYFPPYDAVPVVREDTIKKFPELRAVLRVLGGKISADEMRRLNYAVDGEHRDVKQVVREFLRAKDLLGE